jgi:uncharacterized protein YwqG
MDHLDDQRAALRQLAVSRLDAELATRMQRLARPALRLRSAAAHDGGTSRLGGDPLLPAGTDWPRWRRTPLSFLALIDLAEVDAGLIGLPLPARGLLNFFFEARGQQAWGFEPHHADGWRVIFVPEGAPAATVRVPAAAVRTEPTPVVFEPTLTVPGWSEPVFADLSDAQEDAVCDVVMDWEQANFDEEPFHHVGGWPGLIQQPIWRECQLAYHGVRYDDQPHDPRVQTLQFGNPDWTLLLQLDSDPALRWMWGDGGRLYYATRHEDMAAGSFQSSWMVLQCS